MCVNPIYNKKICDVPIACGKCFECLNKKRAQWRARLLLESVMPNQDIYFITFTYDDEHLPKTKGLPHPKFEDIQKFHKRLRKYFDSRNLDVTFKYFVCSEYGPKTFRPHYHGLYYVRGKDRQYFTYDLLSKKYGLGFISYDLEHYKFTKYHERILDRAKDPQKTASYVANYVTLNKQHPYKFPSDKKGYRIYLFCRAELFKNYSYICTTKPNWKNVRNCDFDRFVLSYDIPSGYNICDYTTGYIYSCGIGKEFFQTKIEPILIANCTLFIEQTLQPQFNLLHIGKKCTSVNLHNEKIQDKLLQIYSEYEKEIQSIFQIQIHKGTHSFEIPYTYTRNIPRVGWLHLFLRCFRVIKNMSALSPEEFADLYKSNLAKNDKYNRLLSTFNKKRRLSDTQ